MPVVLVLIFGLTTGAAIGYLVGKVARERFERRLRTANTQMRSLELDRDRLQDELDQTRTQLEETRIDLADARSQDRELVVVFDQEGSDLTRIKGIGPKIAAILMTEGVETTQDLAGLSDADLERLADRWPGLVSRMTREGWREIAARNGNGSVEPASAAKRIEPHKTPDHPRSRPPEHVPVEVEEPDAVVSPDLEYPPVRFG